MMFKYRKKPIVIEAFQLTPETRYNTREWPAWLNEAWNKEVTEVGAFWTTGAELFIGTLEGLYVVPIGYYVIRGIAGELYPCKPDIFDRTYEPVPSTDGDFDEASFERAFAEEPGKGAVIDAAYLSLKTGEGERSGGKDARTIEIEQAGVNRQRRALTPEELS